MNIDLPALQQCLDRRGSKGSLLELTEYFEHNKGPYCWRTLANTPWKQLCVDRTQSLSRHHETLARLDGEPGIYEHPSAEGHFRRARMREPDLYKVVLSLRQSVTGMKDGLRRTRVLAHGGSTRVTSVFPSWRKLRGIIKVAEGLRREGPLSHPLWNTLLLRLLLLRAHLFPRGNGRAMRALFSYEMNRQKITGPYYFPVVKVLDANRPAIIESNLRMSRAESEAELVEAVSASMRLSVDLMLVCARCLDKFELLSSKVKQN